ncbi:MAG: hypothetical protein K2F83_02550 [Oscillospiraceae bacterium]|nr:hypothetical protein [Oscillospiraceae bacterium]
MNVLLVCSSGITTNILATKLQKYAAQTGKEDFFTANRVGQYRELLPHADVVLIAPQASMLAESLKEEAGQKNIPCRVLDEAAFVLGDVEQIYAYLETCRVSSEEKAENVPLTLPLMGEILWNAALYSVPVLTFGLICRGLSGLFSQPVFGEAGQATLSLLVLYFMFSVGYQYGEATHREPVGRGLIAMGAPLLMLPMGGMVEAWNMPFRVVNGHIPLGFFAPPFSLFLVALSIGAVLLIYQLDKVRFPAAGSTIPMMEGMVKMSVVSLLFIMLRLSLSFL